MHGAGRWRGSGNEDVYPSVKGGCSCSRRMNISVLEERLKIKNFQASKWQPVIIEYFRFLFQ